jgi:hypothetical protein
MDHISFKDSIYCFRNYSEYNRYGEPLVPLIGYIVLGFELTQPIHIMDFIIHPTEKIAYKAPVFSFVAAVTLPINIDEKSAPLFCNALSAIVSFITERSAKSIRSNTYMGHNGSPATNLVTIGLLMPIAFAGVTAHNYTLSSEYLVKYTKELTDFIDCLYKVPLKIYEQIMSSLRLINLAHINRRDDFGLSYYLLVSAIEVIAQNVVSRDAVKDVNPLDKEWGNRAKVDAEFKVLFDAYKSARGGNSYLGKRFHKFIFDYCPSSIWESHIPPVDDNINKHLYELTGVDYSRESFDEKKISDLGDDDISKIISDTYKYRSKFTHEGQSPPHEDPASNARFIDVIRFNLTGAQIENLIKQKKFDQLERSGYVYLASFNLLTFISKYCLMKYANDIADKETS